MSIPPKILSLVLVAAFAFGACGDGEQEGRQQRTSGCPDEVTIHATTLPGGFDRDLVKGAGGGEDAPKDTVAFHWQGPAEDTYIDLFRGGSRNKIEKGARVRVLGEIGRYKEIPGGLATRIRLGRGSCSRYQFEAFKVPEDDFKRFLAGLRRGPAPTAAGAEGD